MTQSTFANFRYKVNKAPFNKTRTVTVSFDYDGHPVKRVLVFRERKDADYVGSAQKQIKKEFRSGELEKYCEQYMKKGGGSASAKPALIVVLSVVAAAALALTGLTIYKTFFASNGGGDPTATYYQVDFDSDGGTSIPSQQVKEGDKASEPKKPTKEGYKFDNWYPSESSTEPFKFDTTITANVTLYARWTTNTFNVTFKTDGGTWAKQGDTEDKTVKVEYDAMPDPKDSLSKLGCTFTGWSPALTPASDKSPKEYTAQWASVATYFTVSFDSDGGTSMPAQKIELGHLATNPGKPDKTGYHFDGWFQDQGGQTPWAFDSKTVTSDVTIYAHWTINKFSVDFNPNGGTWHSGSTEIKTVDNVEYGSIPKPGEELTRTGYTFTGWNPELKPVTAEGEVYTAQWIASDYCTVTFDTQGGPTIEAKKVLKGDKVARPTDPVWTGHNFDGWFKEAGESAGWDFDDSINADVTIYAHWTINKLTANFDPNGGKWSDQSIEIKPVEVEYGKIADPNDTPTKTGYTFKGWDPKLGPVTETGKVYTAQWVASSYFTVTFDTQGGTNVSAQKVLEGENATIPTPQPTKEGCEFNGWHKEKDTASPWDFEHTPITDNVTIYAHWAINKYNIHFDPNGGKWSSGSTVTKTIENVEYGTMADPGEDNPTRDGYTFIGWDKVLKPVTAEETYTAQWVASTYFTVTFDTQGGTSVGAQKVLKGGYATAPTNNPEKEGCEFNGWHKEKETDSSWDFEHTPITSNVTIYAHWNTNKFDISFNPNGGRWVIGGGTEAKTIEDVEYGTMADPGDTLQRDGYTFTGWDKPLKPVTGEETYTAQWQVQTETISIDPNGGKFADNTTDVKLINADYGKTWQEVKNAHADIAILESSYPAGMADYDYCYLDQEGKWEPIPSDYTITSNLTLKVIYIPIDPSSFATDSWETFITYINSHSYDDMIDADAPYYSSYHSSEGKEADTFVGLERTIIIDTAPYKVRVIGEDTSAGQSDAKFTFEFEQVLDLEVPYSLDPNNNSYKDSFINKNLDKIFQYELPTIVRENIKPTTIKYYATELEQPAVKDLEDVKLFVLSASELGFTEFFDGLSVPAEGDTYQYYTYATSSKIKETISGAAVKYWTRTPDTTGAEEAAWNIDDNGALGIDGASIATNSGEVYIAPAFRL